jgi:hypothetical protein
VLLVVATARKLVAIDSEVIPKVGSVLRAAVEIGRVPGGDHTIEIAVGQGEILNLLDLGRLLEAKGLA